MPGMTTGNPTRLNPLPEFLFASLCVGPQAGGACPRANPQEWAGEDLSAVQSLLLILPWEFHAPSGLAPTPPLASPSESSHNAWLWHG